MADTIDLQVIEELDLMLEGIDPFSDLQDFDFDTCRGLNQASGGRCRNMSGTARERSQLADLLSEFSASAECAELDDLYDTIEKIVTLTHCKRRHRKYAIEAFEEWKKACLASLSSTPSRSPTRKGPNSTSSSNAVSKVSGSDDFESDDLESDDLESDDETSEDSESDDRSDDSDPSSYITTKMRSLKIAPTAQNPQVETNYDCFKEVKVSRIKLQILGDAERPARGKKVDEKRIYKKIYHPTQSMSAGVLYVLEHPKISGIFKIGFSRRSVAARLKDKNCYKYGTNPIHETKGGTFIGARQAERIAHALLYHRRILIYKCPHCNGKITHKEWFMVSKEDALSVVELAERYLKIATYAMGSEEYRITTQGFSILEAMFPFSIGKMNELIDKAGNSKDDSTKSSDAMSPVTLRKAGAPNRRIAAAEKHLPKIFVDTSQITMSTPYSWQEISIARKIGGKEAKQVVEIKEIVERREVRKLTPEGNIVTVVEESKTVRKKVSITNL